MRLVRHPILANYYVTYRCNASCGFCDIWEKPSPYVTPEAVANNLDALKRLGVKVVDFTGGEPLLHRDLPKMLAMAKERGFITTVTTNCLLYPKFAQDLVGVVDMLHFSLDSPIAEEHNKSRNVNCFDHFVRSIEVAKKLGQRPDILFTVFGHNVHQIQEVYDLFCKPNNLVLILNPVFEYNEKAKDEQLSPQQLRALRAWATKPGVYLNEGFIDLRLRGGNQIDAPVCRAASTTIVISPEDKLLLPCYHLGLEALPINGDLDTLWRSPAVQQLVRMEGRHEACQGCTINCYMQPSFAVELSQYWWSALPSTLKYNRMKGTWKQLFA